MWLLSCPNQGGHSYRLTKEKDHYVSRTVGEIILPGDQSISRKHAVFKFTSNAENGDGPGVEITDLGSKYGTYINESNKLEPDKPYLLRNADIIKFGCQWNEWRFDSKPLVVTTSTVPPEVKMSLKKVITDLGGKLVGDWQETCSHLTMTNILLTAKVVCALASAVPIVTPEYWMCFQEAIEQKKLPPDHNDFIPPLKENVLNKNKVSFAVNEDRRTMFTGRTFVFSTEKQMKKYKTLISAAGGESIILSDRNCNVEEFCKPNVILMQHVPSDESQHMHSMMLYNSVLKYLKSKGGRPIPESEIGLAILMCSMDMYCNPQYNVVSNILQGGSMASLSQIKSEEVWAADTPSVVGDAISVKVEETSGEKSSVDNALSIPESGSSSSRDFDRHSDRMSDKDTVPVEMAWQNRSSESDPAAEGDKPESSSSRKRNAPNDLKESAAKKALLEIVDSREKSIFEAFSFSDLCDSVPARPSKATDQIKNKHLIAGLNEGAKRKHDDSGNVSTDDQLLKKSRKETSCSTKEITPDSSRKVATTAKSNKSLPAREEEIIQHDKQSTSRNNGSCISNDNNLEERAKIDESHVRELGSRNDNEEKISATCSSPLSRRIRIIDEASGSRTKGALSETREVEDAAMPSTSKEVWTNNVSTKEKQPKMRKKVEERRGNHGMGGSIIDMVVKMEDLIVERPVPTVSDSNLPHYAVNFKKFKKVRSQAFCNGLPEIIGESDLIAHCEN